MSKAKSEKSVPFSTTEIESHSVELNLNPNIAYEHIDTYIEKHSLAIRFSIIGSYLITTLLAWWFFNGIFEPYYKMIPLALSFAIMLCALLFHLSPYTNIEKKLHVRVLDWKEREIIATTITRIKRNLIIGHIFMLGFIYAAWHFSKPYTEWMY